MLKSMALTPLAGVEGSAAPRRRLAAKRAPGASLAVSYPDYQYLRDHDDAFAGLFGSRLASSASGAAEAHAPIWAELVTGNYFQVLGVRAAAWPHAPAVRRDRARPVIRSSSSAMALWRTRFGADPDIVGKTVEINNCPLTVVGVADPRSTARS